METTEGGFTLTLWPQEGRTLLRVRHPDPGLAGRVLEIIVAESGRTEVAERHELALVPSPEGGCSTEVLLERAPDSGFDVAHRLLGPAGA